jgi:hypothetical protein
MPPMQALNTGPTRETCSWKWLSMKRQFQINTSVLNDRQNKNDGQKYQDIQSNNSKQLSLQYSTPCSNENNLKTEGAIDISQKKGCNHQIQRFLGYHEINP